MGGMKVWVIAEISITWGGGGGGGYVYESI